MMKTLHPLGLGAAALLAAAAAAPGASAQQLYETLAFESFDYPAGNLGGLGSGLGWAGTWWAGNNGDSGIVTVPGLDAIGGMGTSNLEHEGSYRSISTTGLGAITENGLLGKDGTEVWVDYIGQRLPGGGDLYGGLTLGWQWVGEQLTIGSPYPQEEWGLDRPWAAPAYWVIGSNIDVPTHLVCKIEFLTGDDRCMLWLDPPSEHPDPLVVPPDLDIWYPDFRFNEIQLKSGYGTTIGFHQDAIRISVPAFRPILSASNVIAGSTATLNVVNCTPGNTVLIGYSLVGGGPTNTPYGQVLLSPPFTQLPPKTANAGGAVQVNAPVPIGLAGRTVWLHSGELLTTGGATLSNGLAVQVQ